MTQDDEFILNKVRHYCSEQERCIRDVNDKLKAWRVSHDKAEKVIETLTRENYLNEERYARLYAGGKFRINHWGKNKIIHGLQQKNIPDLYIQIGLQEIGEEEYMNLLKDLLIKKRREIRDNNPYSRKKKLMNYGMQKGFHYGIVRDAIQAIE